MNFRGEFGISRNVTKFSYKTLHIPNCVCVLYFQFNFTHLIDYHHLNLKVYPTYNKRRKVNWICHILCRNCVIKHPIEGKIEGIIE